MVSRISLYSPSLGKKKNFTVKKRMSIYNYFVKVQIWKLVNDNVYRIHVVTENEPIPSIWKQLPNWQEIWTPLYFFYALSPKYNGLLSRGYSICRYSHSSLKPFHTMNIIEMDNIINFGKLDDSFICFTYPYVEQFHNIETNLFLVTAPRNQINFIIVYKPNDKNNSTLNFLPSQQNKSVPWHEKNSNSGTRWFYVFPTYPSHLKFWRGTSENICLPTSTSSEYKTLLECIKNNSKNTLQNKKTFVGTNSKSIQDFYKEDKDKNYYFIFFVLFLFITCLFVFMILI